VRYKIPAIPFFLISLFIIWSTYKDLKKEDEMKLAEGE
jgi:choline-glycine betaine transporter